MGKYVALYDLYQAYLHMCAWRTEHYQDLDSERRAEFQHFVEGGALFDFVEGLKRRAVKAGVATHDAWLGPLYAAHLTASGPLPENERNQLGKIITEMYPLLVRLDPRANELDAHEAAAVADAGPAAASADGGADTKPKKSIYVPRSTDVLSLARKLEKEKDSGKSKNEIAQDFTDGNVPRANSLLRAVRRLNSSQH